ncbi:MAG: helix-turn-helix domain-containing protein [Anaerolineae bacterium]|nr:helix-turn-helix domain-containing protein [Anaerolineae bacterium]
MGPSKRATSSPGPWLGLSGAAEYLGVHYTTLRRWADEGHVPCIRTPGGRRRFALPDLERFLEARREPALPSPPALEGTGLLDLARGRIAREVLPRQERLGQLDDAHRQGFRLEGRRLLGLLIQFAGRKSGGEVFMEEGRRMMAQHALRCHQAGLTLADAVQTYLLFSRSLLDAMYGTSFLNGSEDVQGLRLYRRMNDFLDALLLALVEHYPQEALPHSHRDGGLP